MSLKISELRKNYTRDGLTEKDVTDDPLVLFKQWFDEAVHSEVPEPNAMVLATADEQRRPNARTVLMKGISEREIRFFTNFESQKALEMEVNNQVACVFWWGELERQVRIRGTVTKLNTEASEEYFKSRPRQSQIGAWASSQSSSIESRQQLEKQFNQLEERFEGKEIPKPDFWGGYSITINEIEFWQGRPGRLHDRVQYQFTNNGWTRRRLSP